jgi:DNA-binding response OmpR family regulator
VPCLGQALPVERMLGKQADKHGLNAGMNYHVGKPFNVRHLVALLLQHAA